jgi:hypothetical protein
MSDIGIILAVGAVLLVLLGVVKFFAWLTYLQEEYGSLGGAVAAGIHYFVEVRSVESSQPAPAPAASERNVADVAPALHGVATPQNEDNELLRVAERAKVEALAALILESNHKSFQNGKVPETRGLAALFGVSASSDPNSEYQRLRAMLKAKLDRRSRPQPIYRDNLTPAHRAFRDAMEQSSAEAPAK